MKRKILLRPHEFTDCTFLNDEKMYVLYLRAKGPRLPTSLTGRLFVPSLKRQSP